MKTKSVSKRNMTPKELAERHAESCRLRISEIKVTLRSGGVSIDKRAYDKIKTYSSYPLYERDLRGANLCEGKFIETVLSHTDLSGADLSWADFRESNLIFANLSWANLTWCNLRQSTMRNANLRGANLLHADLRGVNLYGATMPDGRDFLAYIREPLAGICETPDAISQAAAAWDNYKWGECPLYASNGWSHFEDVPIAKRMQAAAFKAMHDAKFLPKPRV